MTVDSGGRERGSGIREINIRYSSDSRNMCGTDGQAQQSPEDGQDV